MSQPGSFTYQPDANAPIYDPNANFYYGNQYNSQGMGGMHQNPQNQSIPIPSSISNSTLPHIQMNPMPNSVQMQNGSGIPMQNQAPSAIPPTGIPANYRVVLQKCHENGRKWPKTAEKRLKMSKLAFLDTK